MAIATSTAIALGVGAAVSGAGAAVKASAQKKAGRAKLAAAEAGVDIARETVDRQIAERRRLEQLAEPSQAELDTIQGILETSERGLNESLRSLEAEERVIAEADPAIIEAAQGLTKLLRGEQSRFLKPLRENRKRAKADLERKLAAQLGPGFRSSSAGIAALNNFDQQTDETLSNAQFQATNQLGNTLVNVGNLRRGFGREKSAIFGQAAQSQALGLQGIQNIGERRIRAASVQPVDFGAIQRAQAGVEGASEAPFVGDITAGKALGDFGGQIMGAGAFAAGSGSGGGISGGRFGDLFSKAGPASSVANQRARTDAIGFLESIRVSGGRNR